MRLRLAIGLVAVLTLSDTRLADSAAIRGFGIDERLDAPSLFTSFASTGEREELSQFLYVRLTVPRPLLEPELGDFRFGALDRRLLELGDVRVLLSLEGMPRVLEETESWRRYLEALSRRYAGRIRAYLIGWPKTGPIPSQPKGSGDDTRLEAYLLKISAIQIRSVDREALVLASGIEAPALSRVESLYAEGLAPYLDGLALRPRALSDRLAFRAELAELEIALSRWHPATELLVTGEPLEGNDEIQATEALIESLSNLAWGVSLTTFTGSHSLLGRTIAAAAELGDVFSGEITMLDAKESAVRFSVGEEDWTAKIPHLVLYDSVTASTYLMYWREGVEPAADTLHLSLQVFVPDRPLLRDPLAGSRLEIGEFSYDADALRSQARVTIANRPLLLEFRAAASQVSVTADVDLEVGEIVARYQAAERKQENLLDHYLASAVNEIHFRPSLTDPGFDIVFENRFYTDREGAEWEELSFSVNGARWGSDRPAFPLLQPEKVLSLPLKLNPQQDYRYQLEKRERLGERNCYILRFEPLHAEQSLYRGRIWIDDQNFRKLRIEVVQMNLSSLIVSNEESQSYEPQGEVEGEPIYLLTKLSSKQIVLLAGRNILLEKETSFSDFEVNGEDFEARRRSARESDHIMMRDTDDGMRYFVKRGGERQVSEDLTRSAKALAMGTTIDPSFDYPLPIFGINYLNFDFLGKDAQFALLFGGVLALGNLQKPRLLGGPFDLSLDFFAIAVKGNDKVFDQEGEIESETLKRLPGSIGVNLGWPLTAFQKVTANYEFRYDFFDLDTSSSEDFVKPSDTATNALSLRYEYKRKGYVLSAFGSHARRRHWEPWGNLEEFDPATRSYWKYSLTLGKDVFFKTFHKIHFDVVYFGGERLDRFSRYQFGLFDETRIHGMPATAIRFEKLFLVRGAYSFNLFEQFRIDLFYDQGLGDNPVAGLDRINLTGLGVAMNFRGPYSTIVRLDFGKSLLPSNFNGAGSVVTQVLILKPL